jgi:hypothetical protein
MLQLSVKQLQAQIKAPQKTRSKPKRKLLIANNLTKDNKQKLGEMQGFVESLIPMKTTVSTTTMP